MKNFFRSIGLAKRHTIELPISKYDFVRLFLKNFPHSSLDAFDGFWDAFSNVDYGFRGYVEGDFFKIKPRVNPSEQQADIILEGEIIAKKKSILVQYEVTPEWNILYFLFPILPLYLIAKAILGYFYESVAFGSSIELVIASFSFMSLFLVINYYKKRRLVNELKKDFARELVFLTQLKN